MKVKFIRPNRLFVHEVGEIVELTDQDGQTLIHSGHAVLADSDAGAQPAERTEKPVDQAKIFENEIRPDGGPADTTENKLDKNARLAMEGTEREGEADDSEGLEGNADKSDAEIGEKATAKKVEAGKEQQRQVDVAEKATAKAGETATAAPAQKATAQPAEQASKDQPK
jgi:hypothetical protein